MTYDHKQTVRSVAIHAIHRTGLLPVFNLVRALRGGDISHLKKGNLAEAFSQIYSRKIWVAHDGQESLSGPGSAIAATAKLRAQLSQFLTEVCCRRIVDIGCGDFNWMRHVDGDFEYLGIDIVPDVIQSNQTAYGNSRRLFLCMDASRNAIPSGDVALCREVLFHLSFRDGLRVLNNIGQAGFRYVLLTNDESVWFNADIESGDYRRINLFKLPYNLPAPERKFADDERDRLKVNGRALAVWKGTSLAVDRTIAD